MSSWQMVKNMLKSIYILKENEVFLRLSNQPSVECGGGDHKEQAPERKQEGWLSLICLQKETGGSYNFN